jgi:DNA-binding response OmpR family regulator
MSDRDPIRILIIDDDIEYADLLSMQLSTAGYAAEVAEDAVEGGKSLLARPPALILCDINMPYMSGLDLMSLMQSDAKSAAIPVVFISGDTDSDTIARAVKLGAADFLAKPISRDQLLESVGACLQVGGRRAAVPDFRFPPVV